MERLLAYEGPVVHVDHSHRAPAPTAGTREDAAEECKRQLAEERQHKETALRELVAERQHKETARRKHKWAVDEMTKEEKARVKAEEALDAKEEELKKARFLILQLTESERSRHTLINQYQKENVDLREKVEHQAARIRELVQAPKAQAAARPKPAPAPKAAPDTMPMPAWDPEPSDEEKERKELSTRVSDEMNYLKAKNRTTSELLTLLQYKQQELPPFPGYMFSDDSKKMRMLDEDRKQLAKELWQAFGDETKRQYMNNGGQSMAPAQEAASQQALYEVKRKYLYVLYGGKGDLNEL